MQYLLDISYYVITSYITKSRIYRIVDNQSMGNQHECYGHNMYYTSVVLTPSIYVY